MPRRIQPACAVPTRDNRRRFRKQIKRLPEGDGKLAALPRRVRKYKIQETAFAGQHEKNILNGE